MNVKSRSERRIGGLKRKHSPAIASTLLLALTAGACHPPTEPSALPPPHSQRLTEPPAFGIAEGPEHAGTPAPQALMAVVDGWSNVTRFRQAETAVQRNIVQAAVGANGQSSGRSLLGPPWLTDVASGDGERMRVAIARWYDYQMGRLPGTTATQVQAQMKRDLSATYDATRQTQLVNRIVEQWSRRFSVMGPPAPPPRQGDDQAVLDFMGIRKQCLEWVDTIARNAGGRALNYSAGGVAASSARPGMGLFSVTAEALANSSG